MTKYLICVILLVLVGYGFIKAWPLIQGPSLSIASPADHTAFPGGIVIISGKAERAAQLTLDGAPTLHEENGSFSSVLSFPRGGSILTFVATDRFGRTVTATRNIFVP
ncbi:MAG: hypothetical protein NTU85_03375 [Candidatus Kaiserbacteria bacterium]|nr:hypothetical protein [Candidatus Kaiserbacteria bacterium]